MNKTVETSERMIYYSEDTPPQKTVMLNTSVEYVVAVYNEEDLRIWTDYFPLTKEGRKQAMALCRNTTR